MRRLIAMGAVLGGLAAGTGCHWFGLCSHVGGKFDCGYNPADYPIPGPSQPYPSYPVPAPTGVMEGGPHMDPVLKDKDGGPDVKMNETKGKGM
jgi:hypothetical protein